MSSRGVIERLSWAAGYSVPRETLEKLSAYVELLTEESKTQNLISAATLQDVWERHIIDSAQLVRYGGALNGTWIDLGSGAGLPGIVIATLFPGGVVLAEPRRLRAEFLTRVVNQLGLNARVACAKAEQLVDKYDVITARALAPLDKLLSMSAHLSTRKTRWILPKGRNALSELAVAQKSWHGSFHVERSVTTDDSYIVVGTDLRKRSS